MIVTCELDGGADAQALAFGNGCTQDAGPRFVAKQPPTFNFPKE